MSDKHCVWCAAWGRPVDQVLDVISPEPIAAASLGQVYRGRLLADGQEVKLLLPALLLCTRGCMQYAPILPSTCPSTPNHCLLQCSIRVTFMAPWFI